GPALAKPGNGLGNGNGHGHDYDYAYGHYDEGCPPGLAKKHNGCMPPGLARQRTGFWSVLDQPGWWGVGMLGAGRYFYDDGYLVRYDGDGIDGWLPLLGGALYPGNPWPSYY